VRARPETQLLELHEITRRVVRDASFQTKIRYDLKAKPVDYQPGDQVFLYNPKKTRGYTRKIQTNWERPYTVVQRLTEVVVQVRKVPRSKIKTVHADRLKLFEKETPPLTVEFDAEHTRRKMPNLRAKQQHNGHKKKEASEKGGVSPPTDVITQPKHRSNLGSRLLTESPAR